MGRDYYRRGEDVVFRSIAGECFLIKQHAGESRLFTLNEMARWFWEQLARPCSRSELLRNMLAEYEVDEARAAAEIECFLARMEERGLVAPGS